MRCAPEPNDNEIGMREDTAVADPLADSTLELWNHTARVNREIFTEVFRPVPTNLVRSWSAYEASNDAYEFHQNMSDGYYAELFAKG